MPVTPTLTRRQQNGKGLHGALCWGRMTNRPVLPEEFPQDMALSVLKLGEFQAS